MREAPEHLLSQARILLVENEPLIAMELAGTIAESGGLVTAMARSLYDAMALAAAAECDAAVLDVHLSDGKIFGVAAILAKRGIPFVFCTADTDGIPSLSDWSEVPVIAKPFRPETVIGEIARLLSAKARLRPDGSLTLTSA